MKSSEKLWGKGRASKAGKPGVAIGAMVVISSVPLHLLNLGADRTWGSAACGDAG